MEQTVESGVRRGDVMTWVAESPPLSPFIPARLVPAADALWRVVDAKGVVIGHLQLIRLGEQLRYRARRYHALSRRFRDLGDFWSADDAVDCLRFAR